MKATVLVDNIGDEKNQGEWGLSIYIEYEDKKILLDAGKSPLFAQNAKNLGKSIEEVDFAVLSHAHYDHADGMGTFFDTNKSAKLYIRKAGRNKCYSKKGFFKKYIGIQKGLLSKYKNRIEIVSGDYKLTEGVYLIPHKVAGEDEAFGVGDKIGKREKMYIKKGFGKWAFDNFAHEQSLVFETEEGLVVFNSCSHGGADNIINEIREAFPGKKIRAMIGGFHLYNKTDEEVQSFTQRIKKMDVDYICTGHCTGQKAYEILEAELGEIVHQLRVGLIMKF